MWRFGAQFRSRGPDSETTLALSGPCPQVCFAAQNFATLEKSHVDGTSAGIRNSPRAITSGMIFDHA